MKVTLGFIQDGYGLGKNRLTVEIDGDDPRLVDKMREAVQELVKSWNTEHEYPESYKGDL